MFVKNGTIHGTTMIGNQIENITISINDLSSLNSVLFETNQNLTINISNVETDLTYYGNVPMLISKIVSSSAITVLESNFFHKIKMHIFQCFFFLLFFLK